MTLTGSIKPASNRACFSRSSLSASSAPALGPFLWNMTSSDHSLAQWCSACRDTHMPLRPAPPVDYRNESRHLSRVQPRQAALPYDAPPPFPLFDHTG